MINASFIPYDCLNNTAMGQPPPSEMLADTYLGERPFIWLSSIEPVPQDNLFKPHDRVGGRECLVVESCGRKGMSWFS